MEVQRKAILKLYEGKSEHQLNYRTSPDSWSMLDELHHLVLVDHQIVAQCTHPLLVKKMAQKKARVPYFVVLLVLRSGIRVPVPNNDERLMPKPGQSLTGLIEERHSAQEKIKTQLASVSHEDLTSPFMVHPVCGGINPANFITFLMAHDTYHFRNLKRLHKKLLSQK